MVQVMLLCVCEKPWFRRCCFVYVRSHGSGDAALCMREAMVQAMLLCVCEKPWFKRCCFVYVRSHGSGDAALCM